MPDHGSGYTGDPQDVAACSSREMKLTALGHCIAFDTQEALVPGTVQDGGEPPGQHDLKRHRFGLLALGLMLAMLDLGVDVTQTSKIAGWVGNNPNQCS